MTYNEVQSLEGTANEILVILDRVAPNSELIVVDDGSTDGSGIVADELAAREHRVRVVRHAANLGLGGVYRTGFREARGQHLTFFPADGQFPAAIIGEFLPLAARWEMVLGFVPRRDGSLLARLLSAGERVLFAILFGPMPRFQGILLFRRSLLDQYELRSSGRGWGVLMELILRCARDQRTIISVPTSMRRRVHGGSKVNNTRTIWSNLVQALALRKVLSEAGNSSADAGSADT
jgi:glycosyltransferase involved in cell wall biosynthesis